MSDSFRQRVRAGRNCVGAFIKTPSHHIVELLHQCGLDFAVVDAEHAPFNIETLDRMALAARGAGFPLLLRPHAMEPALISQSLDLGFAGIVQPHVANRADAEALLQKTRFKGGKRGFSPSTRAGDYGTMGFERYLTTTDETITTFTQIEDSEGVTAINDIAAVKDIDCLFVGRADLAMSLGLPNTQHAGVMDATAKIASAGKAHGRALGIFTGDTQEIPALKALGFSVFICGTDQSWLLSEGSRIVRAAKG
jgi:2-keto-3-deoxy-L-rhamnonate aldolase RhmA